MTVRELKEILNNVSDENMTVCIGYEDFVVTEATMAVENDKDTSIINQGLGKVFVIYE